MTLTGTPAAERVHIAFFGRRNAGKSSLINALTGQEVSLVSEVAGTTTDPVMKTMELLPLGPVVLIDTPGIDDTGALGTMRVRRARQVLNKTDIAVLVVAAPDGLHAADGELLEMFAEKDIPCLVVYNKADLSPEAPLQALAADEQALAARRVPDLRVSALTGAGIHGLKERLATLHRAASRDTPLVRDLLQCGDVVVLVIPLDASAPRGRLILPQQMVLRDILEAGALALATREREYSAALASLARPPRLVITDSQVFGEVNARTPETVALTSFSILMARYKGLLHDAVQGARMLDRLQDGDTVLIAEGCTHHRQCDDIGTVRLPGMLSGYTGRRLCYAFTSGGHFPDDLSGYRLIIHCGGCMLNEREMRSRARSAADEQIPMTNYGIAMAQMTGILARSVAVFG